MILNEQQTKQFLNGQESYQCDLIRRRFAFDLLQQNVSPLGDVLIFESPLKVGTLELKNCLTICGELPSTSVFGGICFQRLFSTQIGTAIAELLETTCSVNENSLFIEDKQTSLTVFNKFKEAFMFHVIIPLNSEEDAQLHTIKIQDEEKKEQLKQNIDQGFYFLTKSLYFESQRDNF